MRGFFGDEVNPVTALKEQLLSNVKTAVERFKKAYLDRVTADSKLDLFIYKGKALENECAQIVAEIKKRRALVSAPAAYVDALALRMEVANRQNLILGFAGGGYGRIMPTIYIFSAVEILNERPGSQGLFNLETNAWIPIVLANKDLLLPIYEKMLQVSKELDLATSDLRAQRAAEVSQKASLQEALAQAKDKLPELPSLELIIQRIDKGEDPLKEFAPPPPPPKLPDVIAIAEKPVVEPAKKSKAPIFIGAGLAALALLGSSK